MADSLAYQEEWREELIDGEIVAMSPSPAWNHMAISGNIYRIFSNYLKGKKCTPIQDGFDLFLMEGERYQTRFHGGLRPRQNQDAWRIWYARSGGRSALAQHHA